jgi:hypothetical protein
MTGPQPPDQPYSPEFRVPPMTPVQPGGLDDPEGRRRRMRMGIIGGAIGLGIPLIIIVAAVVFGLTSGATGSDQWIGSSIVLLAAIIVASPIQIIAGIVLTAVQNTRPFGVGFLIGSAVGAIVMAGACFGIPAAVGG